MAMRECGGVRVLGLILMACTLGTCGSDPERAEPASVPDGEGVLGEWVAAGGWRRTYDLHLPPSYDGSQPFPLLVVFHGAGGSQRIAGEVGLYAAADRRGFIVAAPDGIDNNWALRCGGCTLADQMGVDDVGFVAVLVEHLAERLAVDTTRVYAAGMSNGGSFTHLLACEYPLAGAAVVAGTMFTPSACMPEAPVPVLAFHGTDDAIVGYDHGAIPVRIWAQLNGCDESPTAVALPDVADDGTTVVRYHYGGCRQNADVVLFSIQGGGHNWPGLGQASSSGRRTRDIVASEEIVDFFATHP